MYANLKRFLFYDNAKAGTINFATRINGDKILPRNENKMCAKFDTDTPKAVTYLNEDMIGLCFGVYNALTITHLRDLRHNLLWAKDVVINPFRDKIKPLTDILENKLFSKMNCAFLPLTFDLI